VLNWLSVFPIVWCCFDYFIKNCFVALLQALLIRILLDLRPQCAIVDSSIVSRCHGCHACLHSHHHVLIHSVVAIFSLHMYARYHKNFRASTHVLIIVACLEGVWKQCFHVCNCFQIEGSVLAGKRGQHQDHFECVPILRGSWWVTVYTVCVYMHTHIHSAYWVLGCVPMCWDRTFGLRDWKKSRRTAALLYIYTVDVEGEPIFVCMLGCRSKSANCLFSPLQRYLSFWKKRCEQHTERKHRILESSRIQV